MANHSIDSLWHAVKNTTNKHCDVEIDIPSTLKLIEQNLDILSSEQRFDNITAKTLNISAEMFTYLYICTYLQKIKSDSSYSLQFFYNSWSTFFNDLFKTQVPDQIILTLSRLMKSNSYELKVGKTMAEKLFRKAEARFSLKYQNIQRMLPVKQNVSVKGVNDLKAEGIVLHFITYT